MARRAEEAENHWPGFVDALSTIVMVVTFLLIILGIVIFVISKNVSKELLKKSEAVEAAKAEMVKARKRAAEARVAQLKVLTKLAQRPKHENREKWNEQNRAAAPAKKTASQFKTRQSAELTQAAEVKAKDKLAIRSRKTPDTRKVVITTPERAKKQHKVRVKSSKAVLSLLFKSGVKISGEASRKVQGFMQASPRADNAKYEVRAFCNTHNGSISEARRTAYYRALATRNELLTLGVKASDIAIKVGLSSRKEDTGKVSIYLK